jgi:hypothetical protein
MMISRQSIIVENLLAASAAPLWSVIASCWRIEFTAPHVGSDGPRIVQSGSLVNNDGRLKLVLPRADELGQDAVARQTTVWFSDDARVPWPYRGRRVSAILRVAGAPTLQPDEQVLARDEGGAPLWTVQPGRGSGGATYRTRLAVPALDATAALCESIGGSNFLQVLPVFQFVREASGLHAQPRPSVRAAFIIDDPNLHWPTYGFADYKAIAADAERHDYHVAFATIPLDAWYAHRGSVAIFQRSKARLSLAIHGNDHSRNELARHTAPSDCIALLRQAMSRIERLEAKSGLAVCRVMVPPHGALSHAMLAQLPKAGYEAACVSAGSLLAHNVGREWTRCIGFAPCELIESCPVLPRWSLTDTRAEVLLAAAYLGQPVILRCHHQDLKGGLDVLSDAAAFVNSLGAVQWSALSDISRSMCNLEVEGAVLHARPIAATNTFTVPRDIRQVVVESGDRAWEVRARTDGQDARLAVSGFPVAVSEGDEVRIRIADREHANAAPPARGIKAGPAVRRLLTEARDRLLVQ